MLDGTPPLPRWAARVVIGAWTWGFISAVVILALLVWEHVKGWLRDRGGW